MDNLKALDIIKALLPTLKLAGDYACNIQDTVQAQPEKEHFGDNFYATALSDADLTIQTSIELALLAQFPHLQFFGEEYEKSYNTKYFKPISFEEDNFLVTLDPIDGTRAYLDGLPCFSIVITIIKARKYEAVFVLQPRRKHYFYALRGKGAFLGNINDNIESAQPLKLSSQLHSRKIYLSFALAELKLKFEPDFTTWCSAIDYSPRQSVPDYLDFTRGDLAGFVIAKGNLIDSAAFGFITREAGAIVTHFDGGDFEPFKDINNMRIDGLIIAANQEIYQEILRRV